MRKPSRCSIGQRHHVSSTPESIIRLLKNLPTIHKEPPPTSCPISGHLIHFCTSKRKGLLSVHTATTIDEAHEVLREHHIDLVLLDIHLSVEGEGFALLRQLRSTHKGRMGVIMITGDDSPEIPIEALRGKADDFLRKPVSTTSLMAAIERTMEHVVSVRARYTKHKEMRAALKETETTTPSAPPEDTTYVFGDFRFTAQESLIQISNQKHHSQKGSASSSHCFCNIPANSSPQKNF